MSEELVVLADGRRMGIVKAKGERLAFAYDSQWLASPEAYPLSLSMPLVAPEHGHRVVEAFLWGLLPARINRVKTQMSKKRVGV